ncbi:MAG TPA: hotdog fold thioesterase [Puia sp.]|jgi:1,4-dihydroxy-2-naphthoyl-CoA hydrolase|nr:hotdog fold thioesterase [Puia sp.]
MPIWYDPAITPDQLNPLAENTMAGHIGIRIIEIGDDWLKGAMPVDHRTRQPYGLLHGGASVALAETLGSVASAFVVDRSRYDCVGLEINANHVRGVREGIVTGIARPIHLGKSTHVWDIRIHDEREKLVCISRLTVAIIRKLQ